MSDVLDPVPHPEGRDIPAADWHQTPQSVRLVVLALLKRLEALETRLHQNASHASRPPSTDSPATKRQRRLQAAERRKSGGKPGHHEVSELTPYHIHQVLALAIIPPDVTHWLRHQGRCQSCSPLCQATVPCDHVSGYGPRLTSVVGERTGIVGASRRAVHDRCAAGLGLPLSTGAIQQRVDRVSGFFAQIPQKV